MTNFEQSGMIETPHLVGALLQDGTARVIRTVSREAAQELAAVLRSGIFGEAVFVCFGEAHGEWDGEIEVDQAAQGLLRILANTATVH